MVQNGEEKHKSAIDPLQVTAEEMENTCKVNGTLIKTISILYKVKPQKIKIKVKDLSL